jgi:hypothetical protein
MEAYTYVVFTICKLWSQVLYTYEFYLILTVCPESSCYY